MALRHQSSQAVYTTQLLVGYLPQAVASLRTQAERLVRRDLHPLDGSLVGCSLFPLPCEVPLTCPATSKRRSCSPPQVHTRTGRLCSPGSACQYVPQGHRSYSALRLPVLRRLKLWFPSLEPTCIRFSLLQDRQGLPDDWPILLSTRRDRTPRRLRYPLDRHASSAAAFQFYETLGTGIRRITRLRSHGSHSRVPTHQRNSCLSRCKARYRPAGLRFGRAGFAPAG
jgi:hypothetical protein